MAALAQVSPAQQIATFNANTNLFQVVGGQEAYGLSNPIELKNNDYLVQAIVKTDLTLTFGPSTDATQVTVADPDFPYGAVGGLTFSPATGDRLVYVDGRQLELFWEFSRASFWDRRTKVSLPVTSTTETTTGTITVYSIMPITVSRNNLTGLYLLQAEGNTAKIKQDWKSAAEIAAGLNIPAGGSLQSVQGTFQIAELLYSVPTNVSNPAAAVPMSYLATDHRLINEADIPLNGLTKAQKSFLQTGSILRVGLLMLTADGYRDVGNSLGLQKIQVQIGNTQYPINIDEDYLDVFNEQSQRYNPDALFAAQTALAMPHRHSTSGDGIYWLDRTQNAPADWINTELFNNNTIAVNLDFAQSCPAGAYCQLIVESIMGPGATK